MREPTLAWWPGTIPPKSTCDEIATTMDILPTLATLGKGKVPDDRIIDGKNISPLLFGQANAKSEYQAFYYFKGNNLKAVRSGEWKLTMEGQLYNLNRDIGEQNDVANENPKVVNQINGYFEEAQADLGSEENCRPPGIVENPKYLVSLPESKGNE